MDSPDQTIYIEIINRRAFVFRKKVDGPGGMPTATAGKVVSLISAGIDSPVAAWKMMRRGCKNIFCHFHSFPFTNKESKINAKRMAEQISSWQLGGKFYSINIQEIQKEIIKEVPEKLRLIFYRRAMFKLAEMLAEKDGAEGLVTGESVAQVASQTLENMRATSQAVDLPIYRPNIENDKREVVEQAKRLGTFEIATESVKDCCSYMISDHPETKASLGQVLEIEKKLELGDFYKDALEDSELEILKGCI